MIKKLCILGLMVFGFAAFCLRPAVAAAAESVTDWQLVRSVPYSEDTTEDFVVVPIKRQRDLDYYRQIAEAVCKKRTQCMVFFWSNKDSIPASTWFDGPAMKTLTAMYERSPNYDKPHLRLACWLYPSKISGEQMNCFYLPGADAPADNDNKNR